MNNFDIPLKTSEEKTEANDDNLNKEKEISKQIKRLMELGKYREALKLIEKYPSNLVIQSQKVKIYMLTGNYEKAKNMGKIMKDNKIIQSQMITIAIRENNYEEAKKIGKRFEDEAIIQSQMLKIAIKEGDYKKVKEIEEKFKDDELIQEQIKKIKMTENKRSNVNANENSKYLNELKSKIYYGIDKVDTDEILQNKELTEHQKLYVLLAIYEKDKRTNDIKKLLEQYKGSKEYKNINVILQRSQRKKKQIFNWKIYDDSLGWEFDEKLKDEYEQKMKSKNSNQRIVIKERTSNNINTNVKDENEDFQAQKIPTKQTKRNPENHNFKQKLKANEQLVPVEMNKQKREKQVKPNYQEVLDFLIEQRKDIYIKMQSNDIKKQREGISQWDKLEDLIEKTKELRENEDYINNLYERIAKLKEKSKYSREEK